MFEFNKLNNADLAEIDKAIRGGEWKEAQSQLARQLARKRAPREDRAPLANLCRRLGQPDRSLKLLVQIVRPRNQKQSIANAQERVEYAGALIQIGAVTEARQLLLDRRSDIPDAHLQMAFACFRHWNYDEAVPYLEKLSDQATGYWHVVSEVNRAAALVHLKRSAPAQKLLDRLLRETQRIGATRLQLNCLELSAQNNFALGKLDQARAALAELRSAAREASVDDLYVQKWSWAIDLEDRGWSRTAAAELRRLRTRAAKEGDSETLRDLDRIEALKRRDFTLFEKVYYGSPFEAYRAHLREDYLQSFGKSFTPRARFELALQPDAGNHASSPESVVDFATGRLGPIKLKGKQLAYRSLQTLLKDSYKGIEAAALFGELFPGDFYNPYSSPNRLNQNLHRLRALLKESGAPIIVHYRKGMYRLRARAPVRIVFSIDRIVPLSSLTVTLLERFAGEDFKISDAEKNLARPRRTCNRAIAEALAAGRVESFGKGPRRRYRVIGG